MSFLAPLFLAGALAIGLPIVFHLARRATRERLPFSSLMFLKLSPPRLTRRSRLEHWLLLLLRCLVILLVAFGFARPFISRPESTPITIQPTHQRVLLIDASASMRRETLWTAALETAESLLQETQPGDQVAMVVFDRAPRVLMDFAGWNALPITERSAAALSALRSESPGWAGTDLGAALVTAAELQLEAQVDDSAFRAQTIHLISDLQTGAERQSIVGYEWPSSLQVLLHPITPNQPGNAGLHWAPEDRSNALSDTNNLCRVRISNTADAELENFTLTGPGTSDPLQAQVAAGRNRILRLPGIATSTEPFTLELTGDAHPFDNSVHLLPRRSEVLHLLFLGNPDAADPKALLYYFSRAFPSTGQREIALQILAPNSPLNGLEETDPQLLVLSGTPSSAQVAWARDWIQAGGHALVVLPPDSTLLSDLTGEPGLITEAADVNGYAMLAGIKFQHPILSLFADPRYGDFTQIRFWNYRTLPLEKLPTATPLLSFDSGDPALLELPLSDGRLLILTAGWNPDDSQLALSSKFVPLLQAIVNYAAPSQLAQAQYQVGDPVNLSEMSAQGPIRVRLPDQTETLLPEDASEFHGTFQLGTYTIASASDKWEFVVNLDPKESLTTPLLDDDLAQMGVPLQEPETATRAPQTTSTSQHQAELEGQQKLWRWLIVAALIVLILETWIAGRSMPGATQTQEGS